jgi:hypothetical protein
LVQIASCLTARGSSSPVTDFAVADEPVIEDTKVAAVMEKRKVSGIVQELLEEWLVSRKARR